MGIKKKTKDTKYKQRKELKELKELKKLPTTRNLLLTGCFNFDTMNEKDIKNEIENVFKENKLNIEFWKYPISYKGKDYYKHLQCISISFETSQECQDNLSKFVSGFIDLSNIGYGINVALDE